MTKENSPPIDKQVATGVVHQVPDDLRETLIKNPDALDIWNILTPLARNEWICWVTFVKKPETRKQHIERVISELIEGKRRPCCWLGCPHRTDKSTSPSVQGILKKRKIYP